MKKILLALTVFVTLLLSQPSQATQTTSSFFDLYDQNRKEQIPNYITLDFILTANYLFKQQSITQMEQEEMYADFKKLAFGLQENLLKVYTPDKKEALAYILVLNQLLGNAINNSPKEALQLAQQELNLITHHQSIIHSPIAKVKLDYSQYQVRGKYVQNKTLQSYFLALKYMSYTPFMVNAHEATGVSPQIAKQQLNNAHSISQALKPLMELYVNIEKRIKILSGEGDDLSLALIVNQPNNIAHIKTYLNGLNHYPKIGERIVDTVRIAPQEIPHATLALKLLPSRFTPDSYIFSSLTYPNVGVLQGKKTN